MVRDKLRSLVQRTAFHPHVVVTDNYYHLGVAFLWLLYSLWGLSAALLQSLPSLENAAPEWFRYFWTLAVAISTGIAFFGALFQRTRTEFYSLIMFVALLLGYFSVQFSVALNNGVGTTYAILTLSFTVIPLMRMRHLWYSTRRPSGDTSRE